MRFAAFLLVAIPVASACESVDCEALCRRTLACEVAFAPSDDPDEQLVASGQRSALESCKLGCQESPTVTVESASCIDALEIGSDPALCQEPVVQCLGLDEALGGEGEGEGEGEGAAG